jgi:hypothetical protein
MKVGVAIYYRNINQYPQRWVQKCIDSIKNQTYQNYEVFELEYGKSTSTIPLKFELQKGWYKNIILENYAAAMNYVYEWIFEACDIAVNVNIDDFYDKKRIELLLKQIEKGADIASSNYHIVDIKDRITWSMDYSNTDIYESLKNGINPVSNPAHIMSKKVFDSGLRFDPSLVPAEDMFFWKKAIEAGFKIVICPEYLHYYRQHNNQATHTKDKQ